MRDQSMRNSARSSTAVPAWTTVQREKRSSGPAALAVHRYWAEPSSRLPEAPITSQLECQQSRQRRRMRQASGGCLLAPTSSRARPGSRVVALAVSPPAPPSKRPCPTVRRRGCSWSGAVTTSPWLLEASSSSREPAADPGGRGARTLAAHCRDPAPSLSPTEACRPAFGLVTGRAGHKSQTATDRVAARLLVRGSGSLAYRRTSLIWLLLLAEERVSCDFGRETRNL